MRKIRIKTRKEIETEDLYQELKRVPDVTINDDEDVLVILGDTPTLGVVALRIADHIVKFYEPTLVERIAKRAPDLTGQHKHLVIQKVVETMKKDTDAEDLPLHIKISKVMSRALIVRELFDWFDNKEDELDVQGFVNFRLQSYLEVLEYTVMDLVDDVSDELEYDEMIGMLKDLVTLRPSEYETFHIVFSEGETHTILDENYKHVKTEWVCKEYDKDDVVVDALLTYSPKNIVLHNVSVMKNAGILEVIKLTFEGRITVCDGCAACSH